MWASLLEKIGTSVAGAMLLVWIKKWFSGETWKAFATSVWSGGSTMLSPFMLYFKIAALVIAFGSGVYVTRLYYGVADLQRQNAQYAKDAKRMKTILALNDKIDESDDAIEKGNQEIIDGLTATKLKASQAPLIQVKTIPASCPNANTKPICLTAAGLRKLGKLR